MQAVILAAGCGSRLGNLKQEKPKGFIKPQGMQQSLIDRSIGMLRDFGIKTIMIGVGYRSDYFEEVYGNSSDIILLKNDFYEKTGSAKTLEILKKIISEDFLLLESDLLYEKRAIEVLLRDRRKDLILASGFTKSNDEVFIELNEEKLIGLSKEKNKLSTIDAEFVGITKVSYETFLNFDFSNSCDYEYLLLGFNVLKIDDLTWCEIDCLDHLNNAQDNIIPKLRIKGEL